MISVADKISIVEEANQRWLKIKFEKGEDYINKVLHRPMCGLPPISLKAFKELGFNEIAKELSDNCIGLKCKLKKEFLDKPLYQVYNNIYMIDGKYFKVKDILFEITDIYLDYKSKLFLCVLNSINKNQEIYIKAFLDYLDIIPEAEPSPQ